MTVIDVDTHREVPRFEPGPHPWEPWTERIPAGLVDRMAPAVVGDVLS